MGLRQWIRDGERYRILNHAPPLVGGITGTEYPYSVQKKNPRIGLIFWYRASHAVNYESAVRFIAQDQSRRLPVLFFQRRTVVVTQTPPSPPLPDPPPQKEFEKPTTQEVEQAALRDTEYEYRAVEIDPPWISPDHHEYPIVIQFKIKGPFGTWLPFGHCRSVEGIDDGIAQAKAMVESWRNKTETVLKQVD